MKFNGMMYLISKIIFEITTMKLCDILKILNISDQIMFFKNSNFEAFQYELNNKAKLAISKLY